MTTWKLPWSASCLCGQVRMRVMQAPWVAMACHCRACQKLTGGAYSLTLMIPNEGFEMLAGEPVISRPQGRPFVNVRSTMLDDASWGRPYVESCVEDRLPGAVSGAKFSFEGFPPADRYPELMAGYAAEGAKPK